jgi:sugar diacid utilization regulator
VAATRLAAGGEDRTERTLRAVSDIGQTMVSNADYEQVLAALIEKVCGLLDAESGGFMLYEPGAGELRLQRPAFGLDDGDDRIDAYRVPLSAGGNAVTVFLTGQPYFTNDAPTDPRCIQRYIELFDVQRFVTVRLQVQDRPIGVFHAMSKGGREFTIDDQELLQLVAPHLAVMIQSAAMLRSLRQHERELERLIQAHNSLIDMAIRGHDLTDIAKRLAELVELDIVVSEAGGQPMVATGRAGPLPAEVPALLQRAMDGPVTEHEPRHLRLHQGGEAVVTRIVAGGESVGAIVVLGDGDIPPETVRTVEQAALVMAITIVKQREVAEVERRLRADALEHLLVASTAIEETGLLRRLGIEAGEPFRMAEIAVPGLAGQRGRPTDTDFQRLHRLVNGVLHREWPGAVAVTRSNTVTLVLPELRPATVDARRRLERVLDDVRGALPSGRSGALIAVGGPAVDAVGARRSLDDVDAVVAASRLLPHPSVVFVEDLGLLRLLARPAEAADVQAFLFETLGAIESSDGAARDWMPFLEALAASNFSVKQAARRVGIPLNTARYRAARIEEKLGIDFGDAGARLDLMVALELRRILSRP